MLQHRYEEAESIILECVFAMEKEFGRENPLVLDALKDLLALQRATGKDAEAAQTAERITKMCERWQIVASV
ncbi:MAG: tetratricopeptide repeat protein [Candidatus Obscuribacterales bacterium]|nr:tetratricopeptide repeat protein [Candidatus Obscuribacterales bacterium]